MWGLYNYNIAKNHNQRYTIIGKCDCGFYIIVLIKTLLAYVFRLVFAAKYTLKGLQYG